MFNWIKKHKKSVQRTGGVDTKLKAIDAKSEAAESVMRQLGLMRVGGERRNAHPHSVFMPERRSA